jgi:hypothetical protein
MLSIATKMLKVPNWNPPVRVKNRIRAACVLVAIQCFISAAFFGAVAAQEPFPAGSKEPAANPDSGQATKTDDPSNLLPPQVKRLAGQIQYVGPDTYILLDAEGRPQPVPGMTYEDFLKAWRQSADEKPSERQPSFTIEEIEIDGQAGERHAELRFEATIHFSNGGVTNVPLGLVGAILQGQPSFRKANDATLKNDDATKANATPAESAILTFAPDRGGFVARFDARAGDRQRISLDLIAPFVREGGETAISLNCPRAVKSKLRLIMDTPISEAAVNNGVIVAQESTPQGGTRLEIAGVSGQFRLTWPSSENGAAELASVLNAVGAVRVSIDGRSVRSDARLTVRSFGGSFDRFRVRLPAGAQYVPSASTASPAESADYRIVPQNNGAAADKQSAEGSERQVVLIELKEKQKGPLVVKLATERPMKVEGETAVDLAGFEVIGAVRQYGDLALEVAEDWQARWDVGPFGRQVDPSQLDPSLERASLTAAFQYDRQPWSLALRVSPRKLRLHVMPQYVLECLPDEARLTSQLDYQLVGAPAFEFRVALKGWKLNGDSVESDGLVDQEGIFETSDGILVLRLAKPASRRAVITLSFRRDTPDQSRAELPMPTPIADTVSNGQLTVRPAAGIELLPDLVNSSGLAVMPVGEDPSSTSAQSGPEYRYRTLSSDSVFVAARTNRRRKVSSEIVANVDVSAGAAKVEERINYTVMYEPLSELAFKIPAEVSPDAGNFEIVAISETDEAGADSQAMPLAIVPGDDESSRTDSEDGRDIRVALPQPRLGPIGVRIKYAVVRSTAPASQREIWNVPLVEPLDGEQNSARVVVRVPRNAAISWDNSGSSTLWSTASTAPQESGDTREYAFTAPHAGTPLSLQFRTAEFDRPSITNIEKVWLQTWFAGDKRQDRAVFRFRTAGSQIIVELPPAMASGDIEVLVDGQSARIESSTEGRLVVHVPRTTIAQQESDESLMTEHTLELRARRPNGDNLVTHYHLTPPQIDATTALSQIYWQLVLPTDRHIVSSPRQLTSASQWQWLGSFWGRQPQKSQGDLEDWIGATKQLEPSADQNAYLYTGLAPISSIEIIVAPRWVIVLTASAVALGLVFAWLYVPAIRRPWIVATVALLIAVLSVTYPTAALLAAQASLLGLGLSILALFLSRISSRRAPLPVTIAMSGSHRSATPRAESIVMPPVGAAASTAPTVSLRVSDSEQ